MKQEKDYFLLTLDETEEIAKEVIRLAKNVKTMHLANPDNPDIIEKVSELQGKAEKLTLWILRELKIWKPRMGICLSVVLRIFLSKTRKLPTRVITSTTSRKWKKFCFIFKKKSIN